MAEHVPGRPVDGFNPMIEYTLWPEDLNILLFGLQITPIEFIKLNNYKINKINIVIPDFIVEKNKNIYIKWINYINLIKKIYDIDIINFKENLYKL